MELISQILWLVVLGIPVACISWTVTHEEVFREVRERCTIKSKESRSVITRKFFYLLTCEYCFSHYVTMLALWMTHFTLLMAGWRGYVIAGFSLVWIANIYMSLYAFLKTDIRKERIEASIAEKEDQKTKSV